MLRLRVENEVKRTWVRGEKVAVKLKLTNDTGRRVELCAKNRFKVKVQVLDMNGKGLSKSLYSVEPKVAVVQKGGRCSCTILLSSCNTKHYNGKNAHAASSMSKSMPDIQIIFTAEDALNERVVCPLHLAPIKPVRKVEAVVDAGLCEPFLYVTINDSLVRIKENPNCIMGGFGTIVWTASQLTARYVERYKTRFKGKRVLELGAGCGLCSIVSATSGASHVVASDVGEAYALLQSNVELNSLVLQQRKTTIEVVEFDWNDPFPTALQGSFDFVFCTETFYSSQIVPVLGKVLKQICEGKETTVLLAQSDRATLVDVKALLTELRSSFGFVVTARAEDDDSFAQVYSKFGMEDFISKGIGKPLLFEMKLLESPKIL